MALAAGGLAATSSFDRYPLGYIGRHGDRSPPRWTESCQRRDRQSGERYVLACGHVQGRAIYVEGQDPDGDGDAHALVVAGRRLVIVKYPLAGRGGSGPLPGVGDRVEASGTISAGRDGLTSIDTFSRRQRR